MTSKKNQHAQFLSVAKFSNGFIKNIFLNLNTWDMQHPYSLRLKLTCSKQLQYVKQHIDAFSYKRMVTWQRAEPCR